MYVSYTIIVCMYENFTYKQNRLMDNKHECESTGQQNGMSLNFSYILIINLHDLV